VGAECAFTICLAAGGPTVLRGHCGGLERLSDSAGRGAIRAQFLDIDGDSREVHQRLVMMSRFESAAGRSAGTRLGRLHQLLVVAPAPASTAERPLDVARASEDEPTAPGPGRRSPPRAISLPRGSQSSGPIAPLTTIDPPAVPPARSGGSSVPPPDRMTNPLGIVLSPTASSQQIAGPGTTAPGPSAPVLPPAALGSEAQAADGRRATAVGFPPLVAVPAALARPDDSTRVRATRAPPPRWSLARLAAFALACVVSLLLGFVLRGRNDAGWRFPGDGPPQVAFPPALAATAQRMATASREVPLPPLALPPLPLAAPVPEATAPPVPDTDAEDDEAAEPAPPDRSPAVASKWHAKAPPRPKVRRRTRHK
jgi:hypothetical protein